MTEVTLKLYLISCSIEKQENPYIFCEVLDLFSSICVRGTLYYNTGIWYQRNTTRTIQVGTQTTIFQVFYQGHFVIAHNDLSTFS